jgi:hypothetical protein
MREIPALRRLRENEPNYGLQQANPACSGPLYFNSPAHASLLNPVGPSSAHPGFSPPHGPHSCLPDETCPKVGPWQAYTKHLSF